MRQAEMLTKWGSYFVSVATGQFGTVGIRLRVRKHEIDSLPGAPSVLFRHNLGEPHYGAVTGNRLLVLSVVLQKPTIPIVAILGQAAVWPALGQVKRIAAKLVLTVVVIIIRSRGSKVKSPTIPTWQRDIRLVPALTTVHNDRANKHARSDGDE
jgi:hypothetical protein